MNRGGPRMNPDLERHELHELARILTLIRATSCNSCPAGPCLSVIRGQPLLAKLDDLTHRTLGAMMSMFNVLVPGNQPSEATTDVPERQSRNQRSDPDTKGRSGGAGDYGADHGPRMEHGLNGKRKKLLCLWKKRRSRSKYQGVVVGDSQLHLEGLFWESVFHPCSIRGSPENLVENEGFLLIVMDSTDIYPCHASFVTGADPTE